MTLVEKELKEMMPTALSAAGFIWVSGLLLGLTRSPIYPELLNPFHVIRFALGLCIACILGAMTFGSDRERGIHEFLLSLPLSSNRLFLAKITSGLMCLILLYLSYYSASPFNPVSKWGFVFLLGYSIGLYFGLIFGHSVNASALAIAIALAIICGLAGVPFFAGHCALTDLLLILVSGSLIFLTRRLAGRLEF